MSSDRCKLLLAAGAAAVLGAGAGLTWVLVRRYMRGSILLASWDTGEVTMSLAALRSLVVRVARGVGGVVAVKPDVFVQEELLHVTAEVTLSAGATVGSTARRVQRRLESVLSETVGVCVGSVRITVTSMDERRNLVYGRGVRGAGARVRPGAWRAGSGRPRLRLPGRRHVRIDR